MWGEASQRTAMARWPQMEKNPKEMSGCTEWLIISPSVPEGMQEKVLWCWELFLYPLAATWSDCTITEHQLPDYTGFPGFPSAGADLCSSIWQAGALLGKTFHFIPSDFQSVPNLCWIQFRPFGLAFPVQVRIALPKRIRQSHGRQVPLAMLLVSILPPDSVSV